MLIASVLAKEQLQISPKSMKLLCMRALTDFQKMRAMSSSLHIGVNCGFLSTPVKLQTLYVVELFRSNPFWILTASFTMSLYYSADFVSAAATGISIPLRWSLLPWVLWPVFLINAGSFWWFWSDYRASFLRFSRRQGEMTSLLWDNDVCISVFRKLVYSRS